MRRFIIWLCVVLVVMVGIFTLFTKKVNANTDFLTDGIAYEGVVARANSEYDFYIVFIYNANYDTRAYSYTDFEGLEPTKGAFVRVNTITQKWNVYQNYEQTYQDGYDDRITDGYIPLTSNIAYEGVILEVNNTTNKVKIAIQNSLIVCEYNISDIYYYEEEFSVISKGASVVLNTTTDKWNMYESYESNYDYGYARCYDDYFGT